MILTTRDMTKADIPACVAIINHIITLGGTTAHEDLFDVESFTRDYFEAPPVANVVIADQRVAGFQVALDIGAGLYSIATFTDRAAQVRGAGAALFAKTLSDCQARGGDAILAKITADNSGGLAFYSKMGFADDHIIPDDHERPDGTKVDRIVKRYPLNAD